MKKLSEVSNILCLGQDLRKLQIAAQQGQKPETNDLLGNVQGEIQDIPVASKKTAQFQWKKMVCVFFGTKNFLKKMMRW